MSGKPNILMIFSDQQRWDTCGCYGQGVSITPNLDRMAREGVLFEHAFTNQPVCGPTRACLQTGKYPTELGCHTNHRRLPADEKTIAHYLSDGGYEVGYLGKWHLASEGPRGGPDDFRTKAVPPDRRGGYTDFWLASDVLEYTSHSYDGHMFDADMKKRSFPADRYRVDVLTDWALEYLAGRNSEKPFFLFLSFIEPHHQNDHNHFEGPKGSRERFRDFQPPADLVNLEGDWKRELPDYLGCVASLDENVGRLLAGLEKMEQAENTLVIYTSDHGCHFRTRNSEYKRSCHEASIRIPMMMKGPGVPKGKRVSELVSLIDVPPTLLAAGGIATPDDMRGRRLQSLIRGEVTDWPQDILIQISESQCGRALRTERWKYSVRALDKSGSDPTSDAYTEDFLYDLQNDPHEQKNLVADPEYVDIRAELAQLLKRRIQESGESTPKIYPHPS